MSMAINFDRVQIYNEAFPSIKPPDPMITLLCNYYYKISGHKTWKSGDLIEENSTQ